MVKQAEHDGVFDPSLSPVVEICQWEEACTRSIARFTTDGKGSEAVQVHGEESYSVNWHTRKSHLQSGTVYRIRVTVNGTELGHADVVVGKKAEQLKNVDTGDLIPLSNGRTLPIRFRIEMGAVFAVGEDGGSFRSADGKVELEVPEGALSEALGITVTHVPAPEDDPMLAAGTVYEFAPDGTRFRQGVTLTIHYDAVPPGVSEGRLRLYKRLGSSWLEVPGSHVDRENHT
ncbi:MAG TPA: hypothetical protein VFI96_06155, partial [Longimicrobiaceae bacterium]|nr:hypothetical protein [Longimicrobiaceae bacterium]